MSNNYHTQLNQQNGMLNEIASNQFLQFDQRPNSNNQQDDTRQPRPQWNNYDHIQGTPVKNEPVPREREPIPREREPVRVEQPRAQEDQNDIQLSDLEQPAPRQIERSPAPAPKKIRDASPEQIVAKEEKPKTEVKYVQPKPKKSKLKNYAIDYALVPALLTAAFIGLIHPMTSGYIEKFAPKMTDLKGIAIRGAMLAVIYIAIKLVVSQTIKKN